MPSNCTALYCKNTSNEGYALVRYPKNKILKQKWIDAVGRGKNWSPSLSQKLCEVHFQPSEIEFVGGRKRVKPDSIPSRFCSCISQNQKNKWTIRQLHKFKPYQLKGTFQKHKEGCCTLQLPIQKGENVGFTKSDEQSILMDKLRRENDMMKKAVSILQEILNIRKQ